MNNKFFEVFHNLRVDENTKALFCDVLVEKIIHSKDKKRIGVHLNCNSPVENDVVYSLECQIKTQLFPGQKIDVELLGIPQSTQIEDISDNAPWENDFKTADSMSADKDNSNPKKETDTKKKKKEKKDYGPNVLYGIPAKKETPITSISDINPDATEYTIIGKVFKTEIKPIKNEKAIYTFYIYDGTDSIIVKLFLPVNETEEFDNKIKNRCLKVRGVVSVDKFDNEVTVMPVRCIEVSEATENKRQDNAPEKRVELHAHTKMSDQDATIDVKALINRAKEWGHSAIAITDHGNVQAFPIADHLDSPDFKIIYGMEGYLCDNAKPLSNPISSQIDYPLDGEMVVFDLETTGLNASSVEIIEIGATKVKNGEVIDSFSAFVNPGKPLPFEIINLTGIDDSMVKDAPKIFEVLPEFKEFCGDLPMVAHNADFDISCVKANCNRLGITWDMSYLDTVPIARFLLKDLFKTKLDNVAKALGIVLKNHHRAVEDAACTAEIYIKMVEMLGNLGVKTISDLNSIDTNSSHFVNKLFPAHVTILAKNDIGRINLYRLVSQSNINYIKQYPRIPKSLLSEHREGLIIGSGCAKGELFDALLSGKHGKEIERIVKFYDYLEVMPPENNMLLCESGKYGIKNIDDLRALTKVIVALGEKYNIPVVASSDAHFLEPEEAIYRTIVLSEKKISVKKSEPNLYIKTTEEMLDAFSFLGEKKAYEIVVKNTQMIAKMCEKIHPTRPDKCPPVIENSDKLLREICYRKAHEIYGEKLPELLEERLERELTSIISNGYALMYIIAQKLVWKSNEDGYLVGSRGSVGSSLVATMAGISEVNPLPAHYYCDSCHYVDFESDIVKAQYGLSGFDLEDRNCPVCGKPLCKDGFDIPFETFLGFKGDKEPDIDLNFSGDYLNKAHKYTEVIFGEGQTYRAGTVGTLKDKTAFSYTKKYYEKNEIVKHKSELERISLGLTGVKRSTGQHPGGIIVLPVGEEIDTFTPVQYPANKEEGNSITTHFEYHAIDSNLLKLDILGKDDPTQIRLLESLTGLSVEDIPLDDKRVLSLFQCTDALGITPSDIGCDFGTLGIPEFNTDFAMGILRDTKPQSIMDLVRIAGLSHGTDVYEGNAKELILSGTATLSNAICTRDDIMLYLIDMGVESEKSFKIMESVRKGKGLTPEWIEDMKANNVPDWYIKSCETIKYMFPKAHAAAYVMMGYRLGYYKIYEPLAFYAAYYSIKATAFDYEMMCQGPEVCTHYINEYTANKNLTDKEKDTLRDLKVVQEMYARGFSFIPIDLYKSDAMDFKIVDGKILPPFNAIEGMGPKVAQTLAIAASKSKFISKDDIKNRGKVTKTALEAMDKLGLLKGLSQSNQLSFFDFM